MVEIAQTPSAAMQVHRWSDGWTLWDFMKFLTGTGALTSDTIFRGHANARWPLVPSLYRRPVHIYGMPISDSYLTAEQNMVDAFFDRSILLIPSIPRNQMVDRIVCQHYGVPTQLLDWTIDPFIALYFAVSDTSQAKADCCVWYINPLRTLNWSSDTIFPYKGSIAKITPPVIDSRVSSQKSVFTVQSYGKDDEGSEHSEDRQGFVSLESRILKISTLGQGTSPFDQVERIGRIDIPAVRRQQLFFDLMSIGVDSALVYPGMQGIGERISAMAKIQNYGGGMV